MTEMSETLETTTNLGEAGGVAWTDIYHPNGNKVSLTSRAVTGIDALDDLDKAMKYATEELGWHLSPPGLPERKQPPAEVREEFRPYHDAHENGSATSDDLRFSIEWVEPGVTNKGAPMVKAFGGRYKKFGVTIWPEVYEGFIKHTPEKIGERIDTPGLIGWYELNDKGNPSKIVRLALEKQPA